MKIIIATDGSEYAKAALDTVAGREWFGDTEFIILSVVPHVPSFGHASDGNASVFLRRQSEALVEQSADYLKSRLPGHIVRTQIRTGHPSDEIVTAAMEEHADLIVLGSHGDSGIKRFLLGSIAASVLHAAPCSVEIVKLARQRTKGSLNSKSEIVLGL